ncbi:MAG: translation initiation factor IF-3 [Clostridia bacterium]|nr:translation initiation factor IF-3 [Clostridia bacterium]
MSKLEHQINGEIRDSEVRLIAADGSQFGVVAIARARELADEAGLDLVKIAPTAQPPVCKIMDYGKFRFEQQKREKEAKKNQKVVEIKQVQLSLGIAEHDLAVKQKRTVGFLQEGNKVKVVVRFRGREMAHTDMGLDVLNDFAARCEDCAVIEKAAKLEGRNMSMFLAPKSAK